MFVGDDYVSVRIFFVQNVVMNHVYISRILSALTDWTTSYWMLFNSFKEIGNGQLIKDACIKTSNEKHAQASAELYITKYID